MPQSAHPARLGLRGAALLVLVTACASTPAPHARMAAVHSALRAAEEVGAARVPSAALHLQLAREQLGEAQRLLDKGQNDRADYLSKRAEADADLSLALAHEAPLRIEAQNALDRLNSAQDPQAP